MLLKKTGRAFVFKGGFLKCKGNSEVDKIKNIKKFAYNKNKIKKINYLNDASKKRLVEPSFLKRVF